MSGYPAAGYPPFCYHYAPPADGSQTAPPPSVGLAYFAPYEAQSAPQQPKDEKRKRTVSKSRNGARPAVLEEVPERPDVVERAISNLWWWNFVCFLLHLVQAVAVLTVGLTVNSLKKFKIPLNTAFTDWSTGVPVVSLTTRALFPFVPCTSIFAWMSAIAHLVVLLTFTQYTKDIKRGINRHRWYEYAFSSSVMIALIGMLFGIYDCITLTLLMSTNACMILFGYDMEMLNGGKPTSQVQWNPYFFGCFAGSATWAAVFAFTGECGPFGLGRFGLCLVLACSRPWK